jgi:hypothetical protein
MNSLKRGFCVWVVLLVVVSASPLLAQQATDYENTVVTRWADPTTRPETYQEYISSRGFADDLTPQIVYRSPVDGDPVMIVVNQILYLQIDSSLTAWLEDLEKEGYQPIVYLAMNNNDPVELKEMVIHEWEQSSIEGVIFVGDVPFAWYEMDEPGWGHEEFPIDLYFMDLDGDWADADSDGVFDEHYGARYKADIWVGRLHAYNLTCHGADEVSLMERYFEKNHLYRTGQERLDYKALAFIDDDWCMNGWQGVITAAYPDCDAVVQEDSTTAPAYRHRIRESTGNRYEHILVCAHSSPDLHQFSGRYLSWFRAHQIDTVVVQAHFYNLFACSNSRYSVNDYMGGWYVFQSEYGVLSLGSTKTGSMLYFEDFYVPLGYGYTYGQAFEYWAERTMERDRPWFYGMTMIGDPTLMVSDFYFTGVAGTEVTPLPRELVLNQNYPNPFNLSTVISYQLPRDCHVRLEVYDLLGRKVATLANGKEHAGYQSILWRASDVSSGIYLYKLAAGDVASVKRTTLVK